MKLVYKGKKRFKLLHPFKLEFGEGTEFETDDKETIKTLKELGFQEVKQNKKEGDK